MQVVCFSNASERAFGCCVYLCMSKIGVRKVSLKASRARVAPLKRIILPILEFLGELLAARLLCFVKKMLNDGNHLSEIGSLKSKLLQAPPIGA